MTAVPEADQSPSVDSLALPPGADEALWTTAVHEAGHVMFAIAVGLHVDSVDVIADGRQLGQVITKPLPVPTEADCRPGSAWLDVAVKHYLAGDRAVRAFAPHRETATGGTGSDYEKANAYLQAVYRSDEVEAQLDRCCGELDAFFTVPVVREGVQKLATALVEARSLDAGEVRRLVAGSGCGAFTKDFTQRCADSPHDPKKDHYLVGSDSDIVEWSWLEWTPDKTPMAKRSARCKRVLRVFDPDLIPPPRRDPTLDDLPGLRAIIDDPTRPLHERTRAQNKLRRLLASRIRDEIQHSPPRPETLLGQHRELLDAHRDECAAPLSPDADGEYFCGNCGFELLNPDGPKRPRLIYQILEWQLAVPADERDATRRPVPVATRTVFSTAKDAQTFLRLTKDDMIRFGVMRVPLPPRRKRSSSRAA